MYCPEHKNEYPGPGRTSLCVCQLVSMDAHYGGWCGWVERVVLPAHIQAQVDAQAAREKKQAAAKSKKSRAKGKPDEGYAYCVREWVNERLK